MAGAGSAVKRRLLPSWMTDDNSAPRKPRSAEPRRRKTQVSVSSRKRTVYCMNEKELVECALEVLSQSKGQREDEEKSKAGADEEAASPAAGHEEPPPTAARSERPQTKPPSCHDSDDPDNDPLKYVREIFFS
ncbi:cell cycle regulator of non-homologous end joining [Dendrobates tinctorius]|uniref:cell cycle regulator of non-homologous end joining n=1 Tax=Dendrobates tinctorius TaxID=92724 RepID=UPI003CCA5B98